MDFLRTVVGVVRSALGRFFDQRAPESAAGMAFYAITSLFPILLLLLVVGQFLLQALGLTDDALTLMLSFFPPAFALVVRRHLVEALTAGGALVGAVGIAMLAWSASGGFAALVLSLNRAWGDARPLGAIVARLRAFAIVGCLLGLLAALLLGRAALRMLTALRAAVGLPFGFAPVWRFSPGVLVFLLVLGVFYLLYRLVPSKKVTVSAAALGALFSATASSVVTWAFTAYLRSGFAAYHLVYGSLGALVSFLVWVYAMAVIVLLGGYLAAAYERHRGE